MPAASSGTAPRPSQVAPAGSMARRMRKKPPHFHCSHVRNMDTKTFTVFFNENIMPGPSVSGRNSSSAQGWRFFCGTKGKAEGRDFVRPAKKDYQNYLNALHTANGLLQKRTEAYELVMAADDLPPNAEREASQDATSRSAWQGAPGKSHHLWKGQSDLLRSREGETKRQELLNKCSDPKFMLDFGPVGDLPLHLAILLEKGNLGRDMIAAVKSSPPWWERCEKLVEEWGVESMPQLPSENMRNDESLRSFIINIPYQNDLRWWLKLREAQQGEEWKEVNKATEFLHWRDIDNSGLYTGETLLHLAIAQKNHELLDYLLEHEISLHSRATGIFFQPKHGDARDVHVGTYFGDTPLCFAASIGDAALMDKLTVYCHSLILRGLEQGWRPPRAGADRFNRIKERSESLTHNGTSEKPPTTKRDLSQKEKRPTTEGKETRNGTSEKSPTTKNNKGRDNSAKLPLAHEAGEDEDSSSEAEEASSSEKRKKGGERKKEGGGGGKKGKTSVSGKGFGEGGGGKGLSPLGERGPEADRDRDRDSMSLHSFLDFLAVEWRRLCRDTDAEDWNLKYNQVRRMGLEEDGYFFHSDFPSKEASEENEDLAEVLLLAFVNARGINYANRSLLTHIT